MKYPIGMQSFAEIREGGYVYVDKTEYIAKLNEGKYFFLSRPRRFGKSLLLSTLEAYYLGRRDLFKGLAIDSMTDEWEPHPVLHLDLNNCEYKDETSLENHLNYNLSRWEELYCIKPAGQSPAGRFDNIIRQACGKTGKKVVILIDEYDKPLLNVMGNDALAETYRSQLKAFYANLKSLDSYIRIAVLTGVARFSKVSIFSDLNNLRDITFNNEFAAICGITADELDRYFQGGISSLAAEYDETDRQIRARLKLNYDGYHFAAVSPDIYNPFSLLNVFSDRSIQHYWFESGTPTFLVKLIRQNGMMLEDIAPVEIDAGNLKSAGIMSQDPVPVLYQTGYLTIKHYDRAFNTYTLDYPNEEVRQGFFNFLLPYYVIPESRGKTFVISTFVKEIRAGQADAFMLRLATLIAGIPYSERGSAEAHFQNAMYILFQLMGFYTVMEWRTSAGRIDLKVETDRLIYIFEFKVDSSSEAAMKQIEDKKYWEADTLSGKTVILIGSNFNTSTRTLDTPVVKTLATDN